MPGGEFAFYIGHIPTDRYAASSHAKATSCRSAGGTPHTVRNEGDVDAVAFVVHSPGRRMEGFSRAAVALAAESPETPPSMADVLDLAQRHGVEMLGPIPVLA